MLKNACDQNYCQRGRNSEMILDGFPTLPVEHPGKQKKSQFWKMPLPNKKVSGYKSAYDPIARPSAPIGMNNGGESEGMYQDIDRCANHTCYEEI